MKSSALQSAGKASPPARREIKGPRPSPLKLQKNSQMTMKHQPAQPPRHRPRPPVVTYVVSPKIIHVEPGEFKSLVQRLTGSSSSASSAWAPYGGMAHDASSRDKRIKDGRMITSRGPNIGHVADGVMSPERLISRDLPQINFELSSAMPSDNNPLPYPNYNVLANAPVLVPSPVAYWEL